MAQMHVRMQLLDACLAWDHDLENLGTPTHCLCCRSVAAPELTVSTTVGGEQSPILSRASLPRGDNHGSFDLRRQPYSFSLAVAGGRCQVASRGGGGDLSSSRAIGRHRPARPTALA